MTLKFKNKRTNCIWLKLHRPKTWPVYFFIFFVFLMSETIQAQSELLGYYQGVKVWTEQKRKYLNRQNPDFLYGWDYYATNENSYSVCVDILPDLTPGVSYNVTDRLNSDVFIRSGETNSLGSVVATNVNQKANISVVVLVDDRASCEVDWRSLVKWNVRTKMDDFIMPYNMAILVIHNKSDYHIDIRYCYKRLSGEVVGGSLLGVSPGTIQTFKLTSYEAMVGAPVTIKSAERGSVDIGTCN